MNQIQPIIVIPIGNDTNKTKSKSIMEELIDLFKKG